jgi:Cu(I)/Ag(I) efflux system periplasmic protein CusF
MKSTLRWMPAVCVAAACLATAAHAATIETGPQATPLDTATRPAQADVMSQGEVRKVDKDARKITIKHGDIKNLNMPAMTMVFQVKDPAMLDQVKQGDKIRFHAEQVNGAMMVSRMERAN